MSEDSKVGIIDLFRDTDYDETNEGYKLECPFCGLQGGRTKGFILFPESNTAFCHSSGKWFSMLEAYAVKKKIIRCVDGREKGQKENLLTPEQFKETLDFMQEEYDDELYHNILDLMNIRQSIELPGNGVLVSDFASKLAKKFKDKNEFFYRPDLKKIYEIKNSQFEEIKPNRFITLAERFFKPWTKVWKRNGDVMEISRSMNQTTASAVIVSSQFEDTMPKIKRIFNFHAPIMYEGKLTFPKKGYDERFESWTSFNAPEINENMTLEEAKNLIYYIYHEFAFQKDQDLTNAIANLLTPALRGFYSDMTTRTPVFGYMANMQRAGKDYCQGITQLVYSGKEMVSPVISSGEYKTSGTNEELRKHLDSLMTKGARFHHSGNNKGKINNATYESYLTSKTIQSRALGTNTILDLDNEMEFSFSGNLGLTLSPDLANRSIFINLFLDMEDPNTRKFENPDLHGWVLKYRAEILSAIYTFIKNWVDKGMPKGTIPFASYPEWASICGGIMESAELGNPCAKDETLSLMSGVDSETSEMKQLFEICYEKYPNEFINKQKIKKLIENEDLFSYFDFQKASDQVKFAKKLENYVGRLLSNIRLISDGNKRASRRTYKFAKEKSEFNGKSGKVGKAGKVFTVPKISYNIEKLGNRKYPTKPTNPTKSDRQVQFWEAEETQEIKPTHTKEEILQWIKENPKYDSSQLYDKFGVGSFKFRNELKQEGKI